MLYCNCHYRYKGKLCKLLSFLANTYDDGRKVRIRLQNDEIGPQNNKEVICSENDLEEIPLTDSILQSCYKMKTIVRDGEWDIIWKLGGENNVTIGEKQGIFFRLPTDKVGMVTEVLPFELVQSKRMVECAQHLTSVSELERIYPELKEIITKKEDWSGIE